MKNFLSRGAACVLTPIVSTIVLTALPARASSDTDVWTGLSATSANWEDPANWEEGTGQNAPPAPYDTLDFTGGTGLNATNNYPSGTGFDGITFDGGAGSFTLYGNNVLLSGNTNGNFIGIGSSNGATQTINLPLNVDWGFYVLVNGGVVNINSSLTANLGGVADFAAGTFNSSSLTLDPTGLIAGLGGAGLIGNTGLGAGNTIFGTAAGGVTGLATISGGVISPYTYSAAQQIGYQSGTLGFPIGADDVTTLSTGFASGASVSSVVVANAAGIQMGAPFSGTGVPNGVTVTSIAGTTIGLSAFTSTAASSGNYAFATLPTETPANILLTVSGNTTAGTTNYPLAAGTSTTYGANNTYVNTIALANANAGVKVIIGIGGNADGGTLVLGSTNIGAGMYVGGIYGPNLGTAQGVTIGDGATSSMTCGPMTPGNPVPGEIIIALNGNNTSNEGEMNTVMRDNLSGGKVTVVYTGGGSMYINTTNAYSGGTYMIKGRVQCNQLTALGSGPVYISGGDAEISLQNAGAGNIANNFFISRSSTVEALQEGAIRCDGTGVSTLTGTITLQGSPITPLGTIGLGDRISSSSGDVTTFSGQITGPGTLEYFSATGTADFVLSNLSTATPNNWTGGLIIGGTNADGAYVKLGANNNLGSNDVFLYAMTTGTARLDLNGNSDTIGALTTSSNNANLQLANFGTTPSTLTLGVDNEPAYFGGIVENGTGAPLSIVKDGSATQVFGGATTYTGSTTVNGGTLWITNSSLATNSAITVASGGTLIMTNAANFAMAPGQIWNIDGTMLVSAAVTVGAGPSAINISGGTLSVGSLSGALSAVNLTNATIDLGLVSASGAVFTATNYSSGGTNTYNITNLPPITKYPATFVLVQATNITGSSSNIVTLPSASPPFTFTIDTTSTELQLVITGGPIPVRPLTWTGAVPDSGNPNVEDWDVQTTLNWKTGGAATYFNQGDLVTFNDTATGTNVLLTTTLLPDTLTVTNNTNAFLFTGGGGLGGAYALVKEGTNSLVVANTGLNNFSGGVVGAGGTLVLQDQDDQISGNLIATNGGLVIVDDNGGSPIKGNTFIYNDSSVEIGSNDYNGVLPTGNVALNTGGSLIFNSYNSIDVLNLISGGGAIVQSNQNGLTQIAVPETGFNGSVAVAAGTFQFGVANELNGPVPISISNGATLDVNGIVGTNTVAAVQGAGVGGNGAIVNNSATAAYPAISFITLTGDTYLGGGGRWDLRSGSGTSGSPALVGLTCAGGAPHNLYKIGPNFIGIVACTVDPSLANIDISDGTLDIEGNTTGLGNPAGTLSVEGPGILYFYEPTNHLNKNFVFNDGAFVNNDNGATVLIGPVTLGTNADGGPGSIEFETTGGTSITFSNTISGAGNLTLQTDPGIPIILAGANTYTGTTAISGTGSTELAGNGGILYSAIDIEQGGTLDISQLTAAFTDTNTVLLDGTLNLGAAVINNLDTLNMDSGNLNMALTSFTVPPVTVTNLILSGTAINLASIPVATTLNQPYPLIQYQNLTDNFGPGVPPPVNLPPGAQGSLTIDMVHHSIDLTVTVTGNQVWNGGSATDSDWSDPANWDGMAVATGDNLVFAGTNRLANTNDTLADTSYNDIIFAPQAGSFNLNGNPVTLSSTVAIVNEASNAQTVSLELDMSATTVLQGGASAAAPLIMGGVISNLASGTALYLNGCGILSNNLGSAAGATAADALYMTNNNANWTLVDGTNATPSATNTQAWGFLIFGGTFNFGTPASAPVFVSMAAQGDTLGDDAVLGYGAGLTGNFNMVNGSLTLSTRLDTGGSASGAVGNFNQTGGTVTINGQFQGDNVGGGTGTLNLSGGTFAVVGNTTFIASRGIGSMTVGGTAVANLATLDVSRGIGLPTQGTVNLNSGGTLNVSGISTATANAAAPVTGATANLNLNGGLLQATGNSAAFITDSGAGSTLAVPLTVTVKAGGAIISDGGFAITCMEALQHDGTLGAALDGGLTKSGAGTLTLAGATGLGAAIVNTYTGPTVVSNGALALASGATIASSGLINIAPGATLAVSGTLTLANGQTLQGGGNITGSLDGSAGSSIAPGYATAEGALTVSGAITLTGAAVMKLGSAANDELVSASSVSYGGVLDVINLPGNALAAGDTFKLFQGAGYNGAFSLIELPTLPAGLVWQTNQLNVNGTISVASSAPPSIPAINSVSQASGSIVFSGTNGPDGGTFYVLSTTNLNLPVSQWTTVSTNTFSGTGTFSVTNSIVAGPPMFYLLEIP